MSTAKSIADAFEKLQAFLPWIKVVLNLLEGVKPVGTALTYWRKQLRQTQTHIGKVKHKCPHCRETFERKWKLDQLQDAAEGFVHAATHGD